MLTLVTVIYGDDPRFRIELFGSILSALKLCEKSDTRIVVFTDRHLDDFPLPITERIISAQDWQTWTRGSGITHLVKLHIVRQTLEERGGQVIYFDTDTLFLEPPEQLASRLSPKSAMMHAAEGPIDNHDIWENIAAWLGEGRDVCGQTLSRHSVMHNSGIVGVIPEHIEALKRSVDIADALYAVDPVFSLDQFSTGAALSNQADVTTCEHEVLHYWGWNRTFIRSAIGAFREATPDASLETLCEAFEPSKLALLPKIHWQDKLHALYVARMRKLNADGRFACIALKSALRNADADAATANRWFEIHLDFASKQAFADDSAAKRLRKAISRDYSVCAPWLSSSNAAALDKSLT